MWFTRVSIQNPVFATMMMVALMVLGLFSYKGLSVEEFPEVKFPIVVVTTQYPGAAPEIVESEISRKMEEQLNSISGMKNVFSYSYEGQSVVVAEFQLSVNPDVAAQDVREKVAVVRAGFRSEIKEPVISRMDPDEMPVISLGLASNSVGLRQLTTRAEQLIVKRLQTVKGVGRVTVVGGLKRQINVWLDVEKLQAFGISVNEVVSAVRNENQDLPAGNVSLAEADKVVQIKGRVINPGEFGQLVVARRGGVPIRLEQLARVEDTQQEQESAALVNGKPGIAIDVVKVQGGNTIETVDKVKVVADELNKELAREGIRIEPIADSSQGIRNSLANVQRTLFEGAMLTILIVFLFLGSWRSTVITGLTLPVALFGTLFFLYWQGFTFNVMTLMALSLCVGLLIDDAIVVRENIVRHAGMGKDHYTAAMDGTSEIGLAVLATTLTIVAVFLPVGFMGGIIGKFFFQFGLTVSAAVLISMFVSFTLDPMLSSVWRDPHAHGDPHRGPLGKFLDWFEHSMDWMAARYARLIAWALGHRKTVLLIAAAAFFGSFGVAGLLGKEFVPEPDLSKLNVRFTTTVGSSLEYTSAKAGQAEALLRQFPEVIRTYAAVNTGAARGKNSVSIDITLKPRAQRKLSIKDLKPLMRSRLEQIAGIEITSVGVVSNVGGGQKPIFLSIQGDDVQVLRRIADQLMAKMAQIPGIVDIESSLKQPKPTLAIDINHELAGKLGVGMPQVASALRPLVAGEVASNWQAANGDTYDVNLRLPPEARRHAEDLRNLPIASQDINSTTGQPIMVPLAQIADVRETEGAAQINRRSLFREVLVTANVQGRPAGDIGEDIKRAQAAMKLPAGYRFETGGSNKDMAESAGYAVAALALAVVFIYIILASQFGSFLQPLAIMTSLPLSLIGVFLALLLWRSTLNIFSIIGVIMLMGLVTKNAILLVDFVNQQRKQGIDRTTALIEAGRVRLRPILMTTFAMVFGMLPLALAMGEGSEQRAPMAHAVIGGVITSTMLTLIVVPVVFTYLDSFGAWVKRKLLG